MDSQPPPNPPPREQTHTEKVVRRHRELRAIRREFASELVLTDKDVRQFLVEIMKQRITEVINFASDRTDGRVGPMTIAGTSKEQVHIVRAWLNHIVVPQVHLLARHTAALSDDDLDERTSTGSRIHYVDLDTDLALATHNQEGEVDMTGMNETTGTKGTTSEKGNTTTGGGNFRDQLGTIKDRNLYMEINRDWLKKGQELGVTRADLDPLLDQVYQGGQGGGVNNPRMAGGDKSDK